MTTATERARAALGNQGIAAPTDRQIEAVIAENRGPLEIRLLRQGDGKGKGERKIGDGGQAKKTTAADHGWCPSE